MKTLSILLLLPGTVFFAPLFLLASNSGQWSLRDVKELSVLVETLPSDLQTAGLSESQIKNDVTLKLRLAKITVAPRADSYLYININGYKSKNHLYVYTVRAEFRQPVMLLRSAEARVSRSPNDDLLVFFWKGRPSKGKSKGVTAQELMKLHFSELATTWDSGMVGSVGTPRNPVDTIRSAIEDIVEGFVKDFFVAKEDKSRFEKKLESIIRPSKPIDKKKETKP